MGPQTQTTTLEKMRLFYEIFPYPNRPFFVEPVAQNSLLAHAGYYQLVKQDPTLAYMLWELCRKPAPAKFLTELNKQRRSGHLARIARHFPHSARLLLVGCGTDEPLLMRSLHTHNEIVGIDLSERSLEKARTKIRYHLWKRFLNHRFDRSYLDALDKTFLLPGDANTLLQSPALGSFDHIQCFGVLHHQPHPQHLFMSMASCLKPGATMRLMIYSHKGRRLERRIQSRSQSMWEKLGQSALTKLRFKARHYSYVFWQAYNFIFKPKSTGNRFRYIGLNSAAVADAWLHPSDPGLEPSFLLEWAKQAGLKLIFCEAKLNEKGWVCGMDDANDVYKSIVDADSRDDLLSNITAVFQKEV